MLNEEYLKLSKEYLTLSKEYLTLNEEYLKIDKENKKFLYNSDNLKNIGENYKNLYETSTLKTTRNTPSNNFSITLKLILILIILVSFIPLVSTFNIIIAGTFLILLTMLYNIECLKNGCSKLKIFFQNLGLISLYYSLSFFCTFVTYIGTVDKLEKSTVLVLDSIDASFIFVNIKMLLLFIPISIASFISFRKGKTNNNLFRVFLLINVILFILTVK